MASPLRPTSPYTDTPVGRYFEAVHQRDVKACEWLGLDLDKVFEISVDDDERNGVVRGADWKAIARLRSRVGDIRHSIEGGGDDQPTVHRGRVDLPHHHGKAMLEAIGPMPRRPEEFKSLDRYAGRAIDPPPRHGGGPMLEFLLTRFAEDKAELGVLSTSDESAGPNGVGWAEVGAISEVLMISHSRALAEFEAKRRIVESLDMTPCPCVRAERCVIHDSSAGGAARERYVDPVTNVVLRHFAAVYAEHPDYREEWRRP